MKSTIRLALATLGLTALVAAQDVNYNFDQSADFTKFKSYKWVEIPGGVKLDDLLARQLTSSFEAELAKKGLAKTDSDNADLFIGYQAAMSQEKQINSYNTGWGYGPRWGGTGMTTATTSTLTVGSVALDMYEQSKKQLVWRGTATKTLDAGAKPDKRQKNIEKGVAKLLKNYPPKKKKVTAALSRKERKARLLKDGTQSRLPRRISSLTGTLALAQTPPTPQQTQEANLNAYISMMRQDLKKDKVAILTELMALGPDQAAKFWPVYNEYDQALTKTRR